MVQWLGLHASTAGDTGWIPGQGAKITHDMWHSQKKKTQQYPKNEKKKKKTKNPKQLKYRQNIWIDNLQEIPNGMQDHIMMLNIIKLMEV